MDFGVEVGVGNRPKIDPKRYRKNDEKKKGVGTAKKSHHEKVSPIGTTGPDPWEGVGGGINPSRRE